ncbi:MAG: Si-specific NAD(P)(+) transhydrogenase [Acidimicrobiales bacterium]|nr:Si-specific NAD(P)(+) transhydrogenase [Hyphomonadaceae bacterium]RZV41698.1 MAG: Si-specific NAD(P)(+) transhydrogenase [Acidimicrobiales bacterium]
MKNKYDFIVIGGGPAGRRGAIQAAKAGKSVLIVDKGIRIGGVCVHTGTLPSKTLRETILNLSGLRERGFYGRSYKVKSDITAHDLQMRLRQTIQKEVEILENQFYRNNVTLVKGVAKFVGKKEISITTVEGEIHRVVFDKILLSVGTKPFRPDYIPFDGQRILDSDEILDIRELPRSLTVIGAGVIGLEYATIFTVLDIPVTIIEPRKTILDFLDREIVEEFISDLRRKGVEICLSTKAEEISSDSSGCTIKLDNGRVIRNDMVLFAAGRMGSTNSLGLVSCGIDVDHRGRIEVNRNTFETKVSDIYAAGDVIGFPSLASTSMEQGRIAACHALDIPMASPPDYFPYGIYSVPEIATIGLTEKELKEKKIPYQCGVARLRETSRGQIMGIDNGMMKMIFSMKTRQLLGVHIMGEGATELIHTGQAVLNLNGKLDYFINNIFNYPTLTEAYKVAALDAWNKMRHNDHENDTTKQDEIDICEGPHNYMKSA